MDTNKFQKAMAIVEESPTIAVDTEGFTENNNQWLLQSETMGISIATQNHEWYFPFKHIQDNLPVDQQETVCKTVSKHPHQVHHNSKHDKKALAKVDVEVQDYHCTMLMIHWIDEDMPSKALDFVSKVFGGEGKKRPSSMQAIIDAPLMGWRWVPVEQMSLYSAQDARETYDLYWKLLPEFQAQGFDGELWKYEQQFTDMVNQMEWAGIKIDTAMCEREIEIGTEIVADLERKIGGNPNSPKDLERILLRKLDLPVFKRTKTGRASFDKYAMERYDEVLETMDNPLAKQVVECRGWKRVISSNYEPYLRLLGPDGRIRPNYNLHRVVTPRMSCSNPNLQNIPRQADPETKRWIAELKKVFQPEDEFELIEFDYKNLEFRLAASYGKQADLIASFDIREYAIFEQVATKLGMDYNPAKTLTYALMYGGGVTRVRNLFGKTEGEARGIYKDFWKAYPGIAKANSLAQQRSKENNYVRIWTGRRRHGNLGHKAFNAVIQGGAAEIVKRSAIRCRQYESALCRVLLHVHDSLVWEIHKSVKAKMVPLIKREMERVPEAAQFGVSFFVDTHRWGE